MVAGVGSSPPTNVCLTLYAPGVPATKLFSSCSSIGNPYNEYSVGTNQALTAAGLYTIVVSESGNAVLTYGLTLERLNPAPPDAIPVVLSKNITGVVTPLTAQDSYTFDGNTAGEYQIAASVPSNASSNVCFDVYQPDGTSAVLGKCTSVGNPYNVYSIQADVTPPQDGTYVVVVYVAGNDGTVNYNLEVSCLVGNCNPTKCVLKDALSYASGTLTMNFTLGTPTAATWNIWLTYGNTLENVYSQPQAITEPQVTITKTQPLAASGTVGVLSTLTTPKKGIACSSWAQFNTGKP
jgi:hypothetical protein